MTKPTGRKRGCRYCCERCDGPYKKWVKDRLAEWKAKIRRNVQKDIQEQLEQNEEQES